MTIRNHQFAIDWNDNGAFTNTSEDVTEFLIEAVTMGYGRDPNSDGLLASGSMNFSLRDPSRTFAPGNGSSPIAGLVMPGRRARYQVSAATVLDGVLDNYRFAKASGERVFIGEIVDAWARAGSQQISTPLFEGIRTGDAINEILDECGWTGGRSIDVGTTILPYWWAEEQDATAAVEDILDAEGPQSRAYVQGGTFVFKDRLHRLVSTASQTIQAVFTNAIIPAGSGPGGRIFIEDGTWEYADGFDRLANTVTFEVQERRPVDPAEVWSTDDQLVIPASTTVPLHVQTEDPFKAAQVPVSGVDYVLLSGSAPSITLSRTSGRSTIINIAGGGSAAVLSGMRLVATALPVARVVKVTKEDAASIVTYRGRYAWKRGCPFANVHDAAAVATQIIQLYSVRRARVKFTIPHWDATALTAIMSRTISDRVTVRDDDSGTNAPFYIERREFNFPMPIGLEPRGVFYAEQAEAAGGGTNLFTFGGSGGTQGFGNGVFAL